MSAALWLCALVTVTHTWSWSGGRSPPAPVAPPQCPSVATYFNSMVASRLSGQELNLDELEKDIQELQQRAYRFTASGKQFRTWFDQEKARLDGIEGGFCGEDEFQCGSEYQCVGHFQACDGFPDCENGADEDEDTCADPLPAGSLYRAELGAGIPTCDMSGITSVTYVFLTSTQDPGFPAVRNYDLSILLEYPPNSNTKTRQLQYRATYYAGRRQLITSSPGSALSSRWAVSRGQADSIPVRVEYAASGAVCTEFTVHRMD